MAKMIPPEPVPGAPISEKSVFDSLMQLDDNWIVLHSVTWQSIRGGRQGDGEADFVLLHAQFGLVVLEVKGGQMEVRDGSWYSIDHRGHTHEVKNPFEQAKISKYALVRFLKAIRPRISVPPVSYAVVFPNVTLTEGIGLYGSREIILDQADISSVPMSLRRVLNHWEQKARLSDDDLQRVRSLLVPTIQIRPLLRDRVREAHSGIVELTNRQIDAFSQLRLIRRLLVTGPAGSGKTILAMERARQLADTGCSVLFLCFNKLLAQHISSEMSDVEGVDVTTFHSLCMSEIRTSGLNFPNELDDAWWTTDAPKLLEEAWKRHRTGFDAVVIDEGQDFAPEWLVSAMLLLKDAHDGAFVVFADSNQEVYARHWCMPEDVPCVPLDKNCRNTKQIAKRVSVFLGGRDDTLGVEGPEPVFIPWTGQTEVTDLVQEIVCGLIEDEGVDFDRIVVLADRRRTISRLHEIFAGDVAFTEWSGTGVVAETIHRFKGLEADLIVLVLTGVISEKPAQIRTLAYVGMSRARTALYVVGAPESRGALEWDTAATNGS